MELSRSTSTHLTICLLILSTVSFVNAQNLVTNYSFDNITMCPDYFGGIDPLVAFPWDGPTGGTPDIFNSCATSSLVGVPANYFGTQNPLDGNGYGGLFCKFINYEYREYLMVQLLEPLVANTFYNVSFYVSLSELYNCGVQHIGAYFSVLPPLAVYVDAMDVIPQIESDQGYLNDTEGWTLISGCFKAYGGEEYITIGNFHSDPDTPLDPFCTGYFSYYYVENVSVEAGGPPGEILLELGDPVTACDEYEIDPDLSGYFFQWSNGSTGPTLTVTTSGTYYLTISEDNCSTGVDSIEVTILTTPDPIDLGPPDHEFCLGDEYTISMDPTVSEYTWQDGSHDPEYVITTSGTYAVTLDNGCGSSFDTIAIHVIDIPSPIDLGDDMYFCQGDEFIFSLDPLAGEYLWQDGTTDPYYIASDGGNYAITVSNICGAVSDEMILTELNAPVVEIGPSDLAICTGDTMLITLSPGPGDIHWHDGSNASNYVITTAGVYAVTINNDCGSGSDQITITELAFPIVELGPDSTYCTDDTILLITTDPYETYLWQDSSTNSSFEVSSSGMYSLSVTNSCGNNADTININFASPVTPPDLGPDVSLCPGEQIVLYASSPNAEYLWQDLSTADSLVVTTSGTYSVAISNGCSIENDTINVSVGNNPPQVDLPSELSLCEGQTIILDAAVSGVSYLWSDQSQSQQLPISSPGTYSVTISNGCGAAADTVKVIDGGPNPAVSLGLDLNLCPGETYLLTPVFSDVDLWLWSDASSLPDYTISNAGMVSIEVSNSCGNAFDTLLVDLLPATPPLDLGPDTSLCLGQPFTVSINTPGVTILWLDGSNGVNYTISEPGLVHAAISNSCGSAFDTLLVSALPDIPVLNLGIDQPLCPGEIFSVTPGIADVEYLWQDGSSGNTYQATTAETIILTISNDCGTSTDTLEIFESTQGPQLDLGPDIQLCSGESITIQSGISGVNYEWQDGSTNPGFTTTQSGVFILEVNNNCGFAIDTIEVDISGIPPSPALGPDTSLCEGISLQLISTADAETSIEWQDGSSAPTFTVTTAGVFTLSESNRCGDAADTITVAYLDAPDPFTLGRDTILCPGETILLSSPSIFYDVLWQDGSGMLHHIANRPGIYSLQLSNDCGVASDELEISYDTDIPQLNLDASIPWCDGDIITLDATQSFVAGYIWSTGLTTPSIEITAPGLYSVEVSVPCSTSSQEVEVYPDTDCFVIDVHNEIYIPNVFSPDNNGINDVFALSVGSDLHVTSMHGSIYDRWGNLVYSSEAIPFQWDGLFAGEEVLPGVYVYHIKCVYLEGGEEIEKVFSGDVTVVR